MRLIDADKLKKDVLDLPDCYNGFSDTYDKARILDLVDEQPTVHGKKGEKMPKYINTDGRWIRMSDADGIYYACSECGKSLERKECYDPQFDLFPRLKSIGKTRYCPHCGAKMEVEDGKID